MSWNYDMQGPFERTDQLCNRGNVWDVKEALASIHPATGLPIQFILLASKRVLAPPSSGSNASPRLTRPMTVPSFGEAL